MDDRRSLTTLVIISALFAGGFYIYDLYLAPSEDEAAQIAASGDEQATPETSDGETSDGETTDDGERAGAEGAQGSSPAQHVDWEARRAQERTYTLRTDELEIEVSNLNGGFTSVKVLGDRYVEEDGSPHQMVTTNRESYYPMLARLPGVPMPADAVYEVEQVSPSELKLTWEGGGFEVTRTLSAGDGPYQIWSDVEITNGTDRAKNVRVELGSYHYVSREDEGASGLLSFATRSPNISHVLCVWGDEEVTRLDREKGMPPAGQPRGHGFGGDVVFTGTENSYFAMVLAADGGTAERCRMRSTDRGGTPDDPHGSLFESELVYPRHELAAGASYDVRSLAYFGPKDNDALVAAGHQLTEVVDLGWFSIVAQYFVALLRWMHGFAGNWGIAIILLTFLVRLLMLPLTWKSFKSMAQLRVLKPEIDKVNEMYKDDQQQKGAAMMELYRKRGVNPFGGCLPSLLQMPVWFAFYASLSTNVELYHATFAGWYTDLSAPDPYFVLPLSVGVLMHFQQRLTPAATDATQAKIMMWMMPIMITSFLLFLPSGLCLYMVTNSVLGMGQQLFIQRNLMKKEEEARAAAAAEEAADADAAAEEAALAAEAESKTSGSVRSRTRPNDKKKKSAKRRTRRART